MYNEKTKIVKKTDLREARVGENSWQMLIGAQEKLWLSVTIGKKSGYLYKMESFFEDIAKADRIL